MIENRLFFVREAAAASLWLSLCLTGCGHSSQSPTTAVPGKQSTEKPVRFVQVSEQSIPETLDLAAKVQADPTRVFRIFPPISGRILELKVKPGDRVERGETIAALDSSDAATARSDFAKAKAEAQRAAS